MKRHTAREMTVEEFDDWAAATGRVAAVGRATDEEGGSLAGRLHLRPSPGLQCRISSASS